MNKKHFIGSLFFTILCQLFLGTSVFAQNSTASTIWSGKYETTTNVNLRSTPNLGNNRIDYLPKGMQVIVKRNINRWCSVKHYKFNNAYIACEYLKPSESNITPILFTPKELDYLNSVFSNKDLPPSAAGRESALSFFALGKRIALYNTNVRSVPRVGDNLIGNIKKGEFVNVTAVKGNWCNISYKNFENAYIYCSLLGIDFDSDKQIETQTETIEWSVANDELINIYRWAMDNNEAGRFYINNSFNEGRKLAKEWHEDAVNLGLKFDWPKKTTGYCEIYWGSAKEPDKVFVYTCADVNVKGKTEIINKKQLPWVEKEISKDFSVPFAGLLARMIDGNGTVWDQINSIFKDSKQVQIEIILSANETGTFWWTRIYDQDGYMFKLRGDAVEGSYDDNDRKNYFMIFTGLRSDENY